MTLKKYLKYNGINLLDPENTFHKSIIEFWNQNGFLSVKQVTALKSYVFSVKDIERIKKQEKEEGNKTAEPAQPKKELPPKTEPIDYDPDEIPF